ncbi:MAG: ATP-binding cassette domain-containing protein, partial [Nitrospirota bacterium]|nr:ATP-binding cassette domain-containing protein [Nitrospirota bacterium]
MTDLKVEGMLRLENIYASYEQIEVLRGISLKVNEGEIVAIIGANGAGKTTTLMAISGLIKVSKGEIFFEERGLSSLPPHEIVRLGISQVPEGRRIFPRLTVLENLEMGAFLCKEKQEIKKRMEMVYAYFPILAERGGQFGGTRA